MTVIERIRWELQDIYDPREFTDADIQAAYDATDASEPEDVRILAAAVDLARKLLVRYSHEYDFRAGDASHALSQRVAHWRDVCRMLEDQLAMARGGLPGMGVILVGRSDL